MQNAIELLGIHIKRLRLTTRGWCRERGFGQSKRCMDGSGELNRVSLPLNMHVHDPWRLA